VTEFRLKLSDGIEAETTIDVPNAHEALNAALNAMAQFACKHFPPPDNIQIRVMEADHRHIATLGFNFTIEYAKNVRI
jgi:hypothetical protein